MRIGFKTGPNTWDEGKRIVEEDGATMCEVWFRVDQADTYRDAFAWFVKHNVAMGLHHWGLCDGDIKPNLATNETHLRQQTIGQIKLAIDIAAEYGCAYVNAHPGAQYLETFRFNPTYQIRIEDRVTPTAEAEKLFLEAVVELNEYAAAKKILFTIETMVGAEKVDDIHREPSYRPGAITAPSIAAVAARGYAIANDFTHLAAGLALEDPTPNVIWEKMWAFTTTTAPATRLLHINRVVPPYNGTDTHTGITPEEWKMDGLPTYEQMRQLLRIFKDRKDMYVIPEPINNMQANYRALRDLIQTL